MNYNILKRSVKFMREKLTTAKKNIKSAVKKFNIIDILLIALIFLSLISLLYKLTWGSSEKYQSYEFVYICDSAPSELADSVSAKSKCADGDTGENLGEVVSADIYGIDGTPDRSRIQIRVKTNGYESDHGVAVGNTVYLKGKKLNLIVGDTVFETYISEIKPL